MPVSRKAMEQRQETGAKAVQIKAPRKMDSKSSDQYKHDDHDTNES